MWYNIFTKIYFLGQFMGKNSYKFDKSNLCYIYGEYIDDDVNFAIKNENGKNTGVEKLYLNGQEVKEKQITLNGEGGIYEVEVYM